MIADREASPEDLLKLYEVTPDDLAAIRNFGKVILPRMGEYVDKFYAWLLAEPDLEDVYFSAMAGKIGRRREQQALATPA